MAAAYDQYDYPAYWKGREYENKSEGIAIKAFLTKIKKVEKALEVGAGFGRLVPYYHFRVKKLFLSDPSSKLLSLARKRFHQKNITFIHSSLERLAQNDKNQNKFNLIVVVRVLHHLKDIDQCFTIFNNLLTDGGYLILEFANKNHFKATFSNIFKGNLLFPIEIFPKNLTKKRMKSLPFINYHPDDIYRKLESTGFSIIEKRSVSNVRSFFLKEKFPLETLLSLEGFLQDKFIKIHFGPSIFILAQKRQGIT